MIENTLVVLTGVPAATTKRVDGVSIARILPIAYVILVMLQGEIYGKKRLMFLRIKTKMSKK